MGASRATQFGFSSPLIDGTRVYQIDNGSRLKAYDLDDRQTSSGRSRSARRRKRRPCWPTARSTSARRAASSSSSGRIADRAEILSEVELPISKNSVGGSEGTPEQVFGGAAISRGRIFFVSSDAVYAIGPKQAKR